MRSSIQLGAMGGKGGPSFEGQSVEERSLIASGAAMDCPLPLMHPAGYLFPMVEEVCHFSRFFWISTLWLLV